MEPPDRVADGRQRRLSRHVALLRGINVGGRNPVPMAQLRDAFVAEGFTSVATYIQSGNVVFDAARGHGSLEERVEAMFERRFGFPVVVVTRSREQLRAVVRDAPPGFGAEPAMHHSDVVFLKAPLTADGAMKVVSLHPEVDRAWPGDGVLYFQRLSERRTQSRMSKIMSTPEYSRMTIRNWNTTTKLVELLG